jgi:hypothetical protein
MNTELINGREPEKSEDDIPSANSSDPWRARTRQRKSGEDDASAGEEDKDVDPGHTA